MVTHGQQHSHPTGQVWGGTSFLSSGPGVCIEPAFVFFYRWRRKFIEFLCLGVGAVRKPGFRF